MSVVITWNTEADPRKRIRVKQGKAIRQVRTLKKIPIADFAEMVGVTPGAVSQWETGRYSPRQEVQVRIAKALEVPWALLFGLDSEGV